MRQSISELDSLLDDLNHAQKVGFSNSGVNRHGVITTESSMYVYLITLWFNNKLNEHEYLHCYFPIESFTANH